MQIRNTFTVIYTFQVTILSKFRLKPAIMILLFSSGSGTKLNNFLSNKLTPHPFRQIKIVTFDNYYDSYYYLIPIKCLIRILLIIYIKKNRQIMISKSCRRILSHKGCSARSGKLVNNAIKYTTLFI